MVRKREQHTHRQLPPIKDECRDECEYDYDHDVEKQYEIFFFHVVGLWLNDMAKL